MASQTPVYNILNSMDIDFESVFSIKEETVRSVFQKLEAAGLKKFLGLSTQEIYPKEIQDFYANNFIYADSKITKTVNSRLLIIDEDSFSTIFQIPSDCLSHFSEEKVSDVEEMQTLLSTDGKKIKVSDPKKELKYEIQLLADIVAQGVLAKAGSFAASPLRSVRHLE